MKARGLMTSPVISVGLDATVRDVADGATVGIISRSNIVQLVAGARPRTEVPLADETIRSDLMSEIRTPPWAHPQYLSITVSNGIVDLWGGVESNDERNAIRVAAESQPGVSSVNDHLLEIPIFGT